MPKRKFLGAFLVFLFIFILFVVFYFWQYIRSGGVDFFNKTGFVFKGGNNLSNQIKDRSLRGFYQWTREDPLFYSPDLNVDGLGREVGKIEKNQENLLLVLKRKEHIYPTDFLKAFAETASLTGEFLKSPTSKNAEVLIAKQRQTAYLYKKEAQDLSVFIARNNPDIGLGAVSFNAKRTVATTISDLTKIAGNGNVLLSEIDKREKCMKGMGKCFKPGSSFEKPQDISILEPSAKPNFLDDKLIFAPLAENFNESRVKGPYRAKTPCFGWGGDFSYPEHYFYLREEPLRANIRLATEIYFRKLPAETKTAYEKRFLQAGIKYIPVISSTPYICSYIGDLAEISEMHLFFKENDPVLPYLKNVGGLSFAGTFIEAKNLEAKVFDSRYPAYDDIEKLSLYYGYLYKLISENKRLSDYNSSVKEELLRRKLVIGRKLGNFDKILNYADAIIHGSAELFANIPDLPSTEIYVYSFKNFYGIMYIPFSPAVYRQKEKLSYFDKIKVINTAVLDGGYMGYTQAVKKYSKDEILRWFTPRDYFPNNPKQ